jgi:NodT family efflux transporter outer membrane factor (OMF) lipoprotein
MNRRLFLIGPALLAGCAPVPQLGRAPAPRAVGSLAATASLPASAVDWPDARWWTGFGDTQLDTLMAEGLAGSPDVALAAARVRSAEALAQQAGAALGPSLAIDGAVGGIKQSENLGIPPAFVPKGIIDNGRLTAALNFNLDLWGKNRSALVAARGEAVAAGVDAAQARLLLTTGIAAAYADLAQYHAQRDAAAAALDVRTATARLTAQRVQVGSETRGGLAQAEARVPQARADLLVLEEAIALTQNRLAALVGAGPDRGRSIARPILRAAPVGLPANAGIDLVGRRPDLVAARLRAEAAGQRIRVARADFYPNLNLTALVGLQSLGLGQLFDAGSSYGNGGLAVSLPVLDAGRIQGRYRGARAEYDAAVARYDATLLTALRETADAVTSRSAADARVAELRRALAAAEDAARIARLRYQGGLSNQLPVLTADDTLVGIRRAVADAESRRTALDIALIRALGGGYRDTQLASGAK